MDLSKIVGDYYYLRPGVCCPLDYIEYPVSFFLNLLQGVQCFVLCTLIAFRYNSLDLVVNRYFGPMISNNCWLIYYLTCGFYSVFSMMNEVKGISINNKDIIFISIWCQSVLRIALPTVICDCLVYHILRKLRRLQPGSFLTEVRKVSRTTQSEYVVRGVTAIISVIVILILFANCGVNLSESQFASVNITMGVFLILQSVLALFLMGVAIIRSNPKAGFSGTSRMWMAVSFLLYLWTLFDHTYPIATRSPTGPCMGIFSLYDLGTLISMCFNTTLFLFIVSEYKRLSEKMCQVFLKTHN